MQMIHLHRFTTVYTKARTHAHNRALQQYGKLVTSAYCWIRSALASPLVLHKDEAFDCKVEELFLSRAGAEH